MLYIDPVSSPILNRSAPERFETQRQDLALKQLDHFFAYMLVREMQATVPESSLNGNDPGMRTYQDLLADVMAGALADSGQMGIGAQLKEQLEARRVGEMLRDQAKSEGPKFVPLAKEVKSMALPEQGGGFPYVPESGAFMPLKSLTELADKPAGT
jgi:Rod binding domain-containing protein